MIVLIGCSGSGKSTIQKVLFDKYNFSRLVTYTTRPPRKNEVDGIDYHFISEKDFKEKQKLGFFAEVGKYREWYYGSAVEDYADDKVAVLTPHGLRQIKKNPDLNICSFYIDVPRRDRLIKILQRGDDIEEAKRRDSSDCGQFDGIEDEVDYVIKNEEYGTKPGTIAQTIVSIYKNKGNQPKKKLTILCDIDGVVNNLVECVLDNYNRKYDDNLRIEDITDYDMNKFTKPQCKNVFKEFCTENLIMRMAIPNNCGEIVRRLMKEHNFYFLTSTYPENITYKNEWLKSVFPEYNETMLIVTQDKSIVHGDILIDDCLDNMNYSAKLNILYDKPWNRSDNSGNFVRVLDWKGIEETINSVEEYL